MRQIALRAISEDNWQMCVELSVHPTQTDFVASNAYSLAQAAYQCHPRLVPLGVYAGESMVGFIMYTDPGSPPDEQGRHWILRVMIDRAYQGQGYGRATMVALIARMKATIHHPCTIALDYHEQNQAAARLYASLGFIPTGERHEQEIIAVLPFGN
jgi:diamine N-acetyltransferase